MRQIISIAFFFFLAKDFDIRRAGAKDTEVDSTNLGLDWALCTAREVWGSSSCDYKTQSFDTNVLIDLESTVCVYTPINSANEIGWPYA